MLEVTYGRCEDYRQHEPDAAWALPDRTGHSSRSRMSAPCHRAERGDDADAISRNHPGGPSELR